MPKAKYKKRKDGRYATSVQIGFDESGKSIRKKVYGKTISELEEKVSRMKMDLADGRYSDCKNITLSEWSEKWLKVYKSNLTAGTYDNYSRTIKNHINPHIGHMTLDKIKQYHIQSIVNILLDKGHRRSAEYTLLTIKQILQKAIENNLISNNVAAYVKLPKIQKEEKTVLSDFEKKCIKQAELTEKQRNFLNILYYTGIRRGEALALTKSCVNLDDMTITIKASNDINHKTIKEPKSESGYRTIPIPSVCFDKFNKYITDINTEYVFPSSQGVPMSQSAFRRFWEDIIKRVQLAADTINKENPSTNTPIINFACHKFRHSYASNLFYAGVDIKAAQYLLGHKTIEMTLKIYTHFDNQKLNIANDKINSYFKDNNL